jgi:hypothetical protein
MASIISSQKELSDKEKFQQLFKDCPIPTDELLYNMGLFVSRQHMMRFMFILELYQKILPVHGNIMELGVRWGGNMALYESFRGAFEPFNYNRKIVGFDTFESFPSIHKNDGDHALDEMKLTDNYDEYLEELLQCHEKLSPLSQIKKFELVKGDICTTLPEYLSKHPETVIALAFCDLDIYAGTKAALTAIKDRMTKGGIIVLDEINHVDWPGETIALDETFGIKNTKLQHSQFSPTASYFVVE